MNPGIKIILTITFLLKLNIGLNQIENIREPQQSLNLDLFHELLSDSLWRKRDAYDASHVLMVPLHYAFQTNSKKLISSFNNHFENFINAYNNNIIEFQGLSELQYLSLVSRYIVLTHSNNKFNSRLYDIVYTKFVQYWLEQPAWQWDREPFQNGIKERILWKLNNVDTRRKFYNVIHDSDFYIMGIASDLLKCSKKIEHKVILEEAVNIFVQAIEQRLDQSKNEWVFQLDFWIDHRDYSYSGYLTKPPQNASKFTPTSIQEDASHSHRWPLWLLQLSLNRNVDTYTDRLKWQLLNVVIEKNISNKLKIPVLNNFMCGHNGYYRWGYETHPDNGYGPFKLSGTFGLGWWSFLYDEKISNYYYQLANAYPLNTAQAELYKEITSRERHPIIQEGNENGLRKLIANMAFELSSNSTKKF